MTCGCPYSSFLDSNTVWRTCSLCCSDQQLGYFSSGDFLEGKTMGLGLLVALGGSVAEPECQPSGKDEGQDVN